MLEVYEKPQLFIFKPCRKDYLVGSSAAVLFTEGIVNHQRIPQAQAYFANSLYSNSAIARRIGGGEPPNTVTYLEAAGGGENITHPFV